MGLITPIMSIPTEILAAIAGAFMTAFVGLASYLCIGLSRLIQKVEDLPCVKDGSSWCTDPHLRRRKILFSAFLCASVVGFCFYALVLFDLLVVKPEFRIAFQL